MPRDTPYSGVAAMFRSSLERGEAPRVFEDGGQMRDFVHVADVARANVAAIEAVGRRDDRRDRRRTTSAPARPVSILDVARIVARAPDASSPWSPASTAPATSATSSPPRPGPRAELGFAAAVTPEQGLAEFATAPLRA